MIQSWILVIAMYSPGGDYLDKTVINFSSKQECEAVRAQLGNLDNPLKVKHKGVCVTKAHWEGKKPMPGVAYD